MKIRMKAFTVKCKLLKRSRLRPPLFPSWTVCYLMVVALLFLLKQGDGGRFLLAPSGGDVHYRVPVGDERPLFVIHVGPHKTGTTFLQSTLCAAQADSVIASDNFYYVGTCIMSFEREDKLRFSPYHYFEGNGKSAEVSSEFRAVLDQIRSRKQSAIIVHEGFHRFSSSQIKALAHELKDFRVIVVQGYRFVGEWLVSRWNQWLRDTYYLGEWPTQQGLPAHLKFGLNTGTAFDKFTQSIAATGKSVFEETKDVFSEWFDDVRTLDLKNIPSADQHQGADPYLMHFVCDVIDTAPTLCREAPRLADLAGRANGSTRWEYRVMAAWAWELNLVNRALSKKSVIQKIRNYHQENLNSTALPVSCPSYSDLGTLWEWTLRADQNIFPENRLERDHSLRSLFEVMLQSNQFCSVDAGAVLWHPDWEPLFRKLA